jgi:hypothetical protein
MSYNNRFSAMSDSRPKATEATAGSGAHLKLAAAALAILCLGVTYAQAAVVVPKGGIVTPLPAGPPYTITIENGTGKVAYDVRVVVLDGTGVTSLSDVGANRGPGFVDDNADGIHAPAPAENDNTYTPAGGAAANDCRLFFKSPARAWQGLAAGAQTTITFSTAAAAAGNVFLVFSAKNGADLHADIGEDGDIDDDLWDYVPVPRGSNGMLCDMVNNSGVAFGSLALFAPFRNGFTAAEVDSPFQASRVTVMDSLVLIDFVPAVRQHEAAAVFMFLRDRVQDSMQTVLAVGHEVAISEPAQGIRPRPRVSCSPTLARRAAAFRLELAQSAPVRVAVYNSAGVLVRLLLEQRLPAGAHSLRYDGTDESGCRVPPGAYYCQVAAGSQSTVAKFVLQQ